MFKFVDIVKKGEKHKLSPFQMQTTQVTQKIWEKIMGNNPSSCKGENLPVERVSWNDCQLFLEALNKRIPKYIWRLPTEKEWEYACNAGKNTEYSFGDDEKLLKKYAWYNENAENKLHEVAKLLPNSFGLYDIHGNVWEWCQDLYGNPGSYRVIRGGGWYYNAQYLRSAFRHYCSPSSRSGSIGFRLVRTENKLYKYNNDFDHLIK